MAQGSRHKPSEELRRHVACQAALGVTQRAICFGLATFFNVHINVSTLKKHYSKELNQKKEFADNLVKAALLRSALNGSVQAQKFYLKTQCGWRESISLDLNCPLPALIVEKLDQNGDIIEGETLEVPERSLVG